jgi:hypothetical protein
VLKSCSNTDVVVYTGENLACTGVEYGDSLTVVLQKLDEKYCEILSIIENCNTTTTTSSTTSSHTTLIPSRCTSPFVKLLEILEPFVPSPPTTTTTTTPSPNLIRITPANLTEFFGASVERITGQNPDTLNISLQVNRHSLIDCTGGSSSFSFNLTLDAGDDFYFGGTTSQNANLSAKIVSLTVNGNTITTSPPTLPVNGTDYVIEGFNVCTVL